MRKPVSVDFVVPDLFESVGGIARIARSMVLALGSWADGQNVPLRVSVLVDRSGQRDKRYLAARHELKVYGGDRLAMSRDLVLRAWSQPGRRAFVFAHPHLGTLAAAFPFGTRSAVVAHGMDVWTPMKLERRLALRRASRYWPVSRDTARHLRETQGLDGKKVRPLLNALDPFWPLPELVPSGRGHLLTVARLHPKHQYKGVDVTIEALAKIPRERRLPFVVAGDGPDRVRLEALALTRDVDVRFLGEVAEAELIEHFAGAAAFVMPSAGEGFGLVYLEAMAFGLPCVAARAGGAPEVVIDGRTGVVIEPRNVEALMSAIERVTGPEGLVLGAAGRRRVESEFLFASYERRVHAAMDELIV